jgi:hypothetical protein
MAIYENYFKKILNEDGPNYIASTPNTSGRGGALGNANSMYTTGSASGTTGTDNYAAGDSRIPDSIFGGVVKRKNKKKNGPRSLANKSRSRRK